MSVGCHPLVGQLFDRFLVLFQMCQSHAAQYVRCLGELDVVVTDNLDAVAPWVKKVEESAGQWMDAGGSQRFADCLLVVDHKPKMAAVVSALGTALLKCEKLVAKIDEGRRAAFAPKLEIEQSTVESQSLVEIADLKSYMIETNGARFSCLRHWALRQLA